MKKHNLKTWPEYFRAVRNREKTFEVRLNDRDFKVDDILVLKEFDPCGTCKGHGRIRTAPDEMDPCPDCPLSLDGDYESAMRASKASGGRYTGLESSHRVTYILGEHQGVREGYVVMGLARAYLPAQEKVI